MLSSEAVSIHAVGTCADIVTSTWACDSADMAPPPCSLLTRCAPSCMRLSRNRACTAWEVDSWAVLLLRRPQHAQRASNSLHAAPDQGAKQPVAAWCGPCRPGCPPCTCQSHKVLAQAPQCCRCDAQLQPSAQRHDSVLAWWPSSNLLARCNCWLVVNNLPTPT